VDGVLSALELQIKFWMSSPNFSERLPVPEDGFTFNEGSQDLSGYDYTNVLSYLTAPPTGQRNAKSDVLSNRDAEIARLLRKDRYVHSSNLD
jgi:hypothetical protein